MKDAWNLPGLALAAIQAGRVRRANVALVRLYPTLAGVVDQPWPEALGLDQTEAALAWWVSAIASTGPRVLVTAAAGGKRWLRLRAHAEKADTEAVLSVEDVTDDQVARERMRREGEHFHALIERSAEGISIFDATAKILYESPSNKRIHGYDAAEMEGRNLFDFCHPDDMKRVMPRFVHLAEGPGVVETDIVRFRHKAGHFIYLEGTVLNATDDPRVNGLVNNFRDVTGRIEAERELRRAKDAAEQAQRLQQHFLTNLSHEFKTPLTLIRGPLADLAADRLAPQRRPEAWQLVERNVERLDGLLTELIDLARLEAGAFSLRAKQHDLAAFLRSQVAWFVPQAAAKEITLRLKAPAERLVFFDATKMEKVVGNLIGNALKFSSARTTIEMTLNVAADPEAAAEYVEVRVKDEGTGMDAATQARVFERFFQGDAGLARGHEGMGIGMAITRELVELHGGTIRVESTVGAGSTFVFTLPLGCEHLDPDDIDTTAAPEPRPHTIGTTRFQSGHSESDAGSKTARPRLLLVEDNVDMRLYLRMHLDPHYIVYEAANGLEALDALAKVVPDIVLSDVMMPQLDGLEFCRRLRQNPRYAKLPVLLLSAKALADQRVEGLQAGADDYLAKPFSISELLQRLTARLPKQPAPESSAGADEWTERLLACITQHLGSPEFGVESLAKRMGYSSRQLRRRMLEQQGKTPEAILLERRLQRGRELLESRQLETMAEVAHAVGLSPGYFSRRYRQAYRDR